MLSKEEEPRNSVFEQFYSQVEPSHQEFVVPSKKYANELVSQESYLANCDAIISKSLRYISDLKRKKQTDLSL